MAEPSAMSDEITLEEAIQIRDSFRRVWIVAISVGIVSAAPVLILKDSAPWIIVLPIFAGIAIGLFLEWRSEEGRGINIERLPRDYIGLREFGRKFEIQISKWKSPATQQIFDFLPEQKSAAKRIRTVKTLSGEQLYVVNCSAFVDILVSRLLDDSDKMVEMTMVQAARRFGEENREKKIFFTGADLEIIKNDFRGNWITLVSRNGEKVLRQLQKSLESEKPDAATEKKSTGVQ
jgi:hypothetical protein